MLWPSAAGTGPLEAMELLEDRGAVLGEAGQVWFHLFTKSTRCEVPLGTRIVTGLASQWVSSQQRFHQRLVLPGQGSELRRN